MAATNVQDRDQAERVRSAFAAELREFRVGFRVEYLPCEGSDWKTFGSYPERGEALRDIEWLDSRGNTTRLRLMGNLPTGE